MSTEPIIASASSPYITDDPRRFPTNFTWGSATASFQIEGAHDADGKSESIWDRFCDTPGAIIDASNGHVACDHYHRMPDDVALMSSLGLGAYRFSMAWTRVLPAGIGPVNAAGLDFYDRLVDELLAAGITPYPTLYHWDLPQVLQDTGGWVNRETAYAFADYAEAVVDRLGDRVSAWTTFNEPFVVSNHGYVTGEHAPGHTSLAEGFAAAHHLLVAHGLAGQRIRSLAPDAELGIVLNFTPTEPASDHPDDLRETAIVEDIENRWYADPLCGRGYPQATVDSLEWNQSEIRDGDLELIAQPIDLLGVNFYTRQVVAADHEEQPKEFPTNAMGWEIHPPSLGKLLRWLHATYAFPKYLITENGAAMPDDRRVDGRADGQIDDADRIAYVHGHLAEVHAAIADGVPVEGYFVWSLLDNFEWAWGYTSRFGIVEVDFDTLERRPKRSADWYRDVATSNTLPPLHDAAVVAPNEEILS